MEDNLSNLKQGSSLQGGKYVIEKTLGQGGFGITYLGVQVALNRRVAIKEFFMKEYCERDSGTSHVTVGSQGSRDIVDRFRTKFVKEAQTIAQLDNPRVIKIHDIFEENGTAYYVMEYIEGGSLEQYVNKRQRLDESSALEFVGQIADALTYIHGKNILHLDVKPSNVLLRESGDAVLIDFGISKHYDESGEQSSATPVGRSKGYAPFEQYTEGGVSHFDQRTDVYSLGAVLYKLLTGSRPEEASVLISEGLDIPAYVSSRCASVIRKALSSKKSERYQSAAEMKAALGAGGSEEEATITNKEEEKRVNVIKIEDGRQKPKKRFSSVAWAVFAVALVIVSYMLLKSSPSSGSSSPSDGEDVVTSVASNPTLTLSCKTTGASLYVDGKKKGTGKWSGELSAGSHKLEARLDGYQTATKTLNMSDGGTYSHTFPALTAVSTKSESSTGTNASSSSTASVGKINGHEYVDLGLSVKWATCNVGASSPTDYGNYYAWGETSTKSEYTVENSKTYGKSMGDIAGNSTYDAARANWGGSWRLPTLEEFEELFRSCELEWTNVSGVEGCKLTSNQNGKSIFLPAAGWWLSSLDHANQDGSYWGASPDDVDSADVLLFENGRYSTHSRFKRFVGLSIRPVSE